MRDDARESRTLRAALLVAKACLLTGCIIPFNGPGDIKRDVQSATGSDLDMDFGLTVGRSGMAFARWMLKESEEEVPPLEGIKKVEIGIYHVTDPAPGRDRSLHAMQWPGWIPVVEVHGGDGRAVTDGDGGSTDALILFQYDEERLERMLLLVEEKDDRMVIIRISGDLNQLIEQVIAYGLEKSEHPELIDPAIDSYRQREEGSPVGDAPSPEPGQR